MSVVVGPVAKIRSLCALVDEAIGYPKYGKVAGTDTPIIAQPGQTINEVEGVELGWAPVYPSPVDPALAYYQLDAVNESIADAILLDTRFLGCFKRPTRDMTLWPELA